MEQEESRALQAAAAELAIRLKGIADEVARAVRPQRVRYGHGLIKRRSPAGFVVSSSDRQLLLPDGRLWTYGSYDTGSGGHFFDARVDYTKFSGGRMTIRGVQFVFLGVVLGAYTFGVAFHSRVLDRPGPGTLAAITGEGGSVRFVDPDVALADIAGRLSARQETGQTVTH